MSPTADRSAGTPARIVSQVCNFQYFARVGAAGVGVERQIYMGTIPNRWEYDITIINLSTSVPGK